MGTHVGGTDPHFDPEEELASAAADFGRGSGQDEVPQQLPLRTYQVYELTSSILPIPVAINGYVLYGRCLKHLVVNMPNTF